MEKILKIDGKEIAFKATGATPRIYRDTFGRDIFKDMQSLTANAATGGEFTIDSLECFENIAYIMAYQADPNIPDPTSWLDQFSMFSIYHVLPELIMLWNENEAQIEKPKKKAGRQSAN